MSKRFSAPAAYLSATPCVKAIAPNSVTSQAPSSHLGMNLKTCRGAGLRSNELLVTNTFTSYLPSSRASSRGSDGNFVVEGLAVGAGSPPDHQEKRSSQAVHPRYMRRPRGVPLSPWRPGLRALPDTRTCQAEGRRD